MACAGRLGLLLLLLPMSSAKRTKSSFLFHKRMGDACDDHDECQSGCCVTNSRSPQTFCVSKTLFLKCHSWWKPSRYPCSRHGECRSRCCVTSSASPAKFCKPQSIFQQCTPWRKPHRAHCGHHKECQSQCCIALSELGRPRCVRRSGLLAQCLPL